MNKKGQQKLMEETVGVIIAVLGILLILLAIIVGLFYYFTNQELQNAQNTLNSLASKINLLNNDQSAEVTFQGYPNGNDWYLVGWSNGEAGRPDKCFFSSCICICKASASAQSSSDLEYNQNQIKSNYFTTTCQTPGTGICANFNSKNIMVASQAVTFTSKTPPQQNSLTDMYIIPYVKVSDNLYQLNISKGVGGISVLE